MANFKPAMWGHWKWSWEEMYTIWAWPEAVPARPWETPKVVWEERWICFLCPSRSLSTPPHTALKAELDQQIPLLSHVPWSLVVTSQWGAVAGKKERQRLRVSLTFQFLPYEVISSVWVTWQCPAGFMAMLLSVCLHSSFSLSLQVPVLLLLLLFQAKEWEVSLFFLAVLFLLVSMLCPNLQIIFLSSFRIIEIEHAIFFCE